MGSRKDVNKAAWLRLSVEAFALARPSAPRLFVCPLCVRGFDKLDSLTFEDVPPKSIGGKPLLLTCRSCNKASGRVLDPNIRAGRDLREIAEGSRETWIKLTQFGHAVTAKARFGRASIQIAAVPEKSNPDAHRSLFSKLEEVARAGSSDWGGTITFGVRHNPWLEAVGWLRVAYLYAFAALGYNFILRPELNAVREQLLRPTERILPQAMKHTAGTAAEDGISFVYSPVDLRGILVRLGVNLFFFPGFVEAASLYERLGKFRQTGEDVTLSGLHTDLPRRPSFQFDYHPASIWLTVPPEDRAVGKKGV